MQLRNPRHFSPALLITALAFLFCAAGFLIAPITSAQKVKQLLEADPPYGARVRFEYGQAATGWNAPATAAWLDRAVSQASQKHYGQPAMWMGEGGTIPFMAMLG